MTNPHDNQTSRDHGAPDILTSTERARREANENKVTSVLAANLVTESITTSARFDLSTPIDLPFDLPEDRYRYRLLAVEVTATRTLGVRPSDPDTMPGEPPHLEVRGLVQDVKADGMPYARRHPYWTALPQGAGRAPPRSSPRLLAHRVRAPPHPSRHRRDNSMPEKPRQPGPRRRHPRGGGLSDAQILVMREALDWIGDGDRASAIMLLDLLSDPHAHYLALRLARGLHARPPASITRDLSPVLTLAVAVAVLNAGAVPSGLDPDDAEQLAADVVALGRRVRGLYRTEADAAVAKRKIGDVTARIEPAFQAGYLLVTPSRP
jgi:hypothetical protein